MPLCIERLQAAARDSALSRAQVEELLNEMRAYHPSLELDLLWLSTPGDRDQSLSLRQLDKSDFFTRDIDEALANGLCRIAVHSAKDLPEPLPDSLAIVALTKGVDHRDSLVLREGLTWQNLPPHPLIATSSERREQSVKAVLPKAHFCDLRGTIHNRLAQLDGGAFDGLVMAEAALLRLKIDRPRWILPGEAAPLQGQLAILARKEDEQMRDFFRPLDSRRC